MFHGPREMIMPFFEGQGFACPLEKGDADFLQEVTTVGEQQVGTADGAPPISTCPNPLPHTPHTPPHLSVAHC